MKNLFLKNCTIDQLEERNILIKKIHKYLWVAILFFWWHVLFRLIFTQFNPPNVENIIFSMVLMLIGFRFELWSTPYGYNPSRDNGLDVYDYYVNNISIHQRKFFTLKLHKEGDVNPLW
jgi:hypothetical protein